MRPLTAEEVVQAIEDILKPEWLVGLVLPAYVGAENEARIRAIRSVMESYSMSLSERDLP